MRQILILMFLTVLLAGLVSAITIPHAFYGAVSVEDGAIVTAELNGVEVDSCKVLNNKYGYGDDTLIVTDDNENGGTITFYVDGVKADEEYTFESGEVTRLDLIVNGVAPPVCVEDWSCTDWSACVEETQTRTCTDNNDCGTTDDKPTETQSCETDTTTTETESSSSSSSSGGGGGGGSSSSSSGGGGGSSGTTSSGSTSTSSTGSSSSSTTSSSESENEDNLGVNAGSGDEEINNEEATVGTNALTGALVGFFKGENLTKIGATALSVIAILAVLGGCLLYAKKRKS